MKSSSRLWQRDTGTLVIGVIRKHCTPKARLHFYFCKPMLPQKTKLKNHTEICVLLSPKQDIFFTRGLEDNCKEIHSFCGAFRAIPLSYPSTAYGSDFQQPIHGRVQVYRCKRSKNTRLNHLQRANIGTIMKFVEEITK